LKIATTGAMTDGNTQTDRQTPAILLSHAMQ